MIYSSWDIEQNILKLVILGHFLPFYPLTYPKNQDFKKWKNLLEISSFYTCVPKITIIWCMVPEIWSATYRIFCHYGLFFAFLPPPPTHYGPRKSKFWKNDKTLEDIIILMTINDSQWFFWYGVQQTKLFVILDCFLPFYPPNNPKNQNFEKLKKNPRDIIILHKCT